jgi:branched-chain amino acid transport system ATP-binding protein
VKRIREIGVAIIMVEHVMEIVMPLVDRIVVLDLGKIIASGSAAEITTDPLVVAAYLGESIRA